MSKDSGSITTVGKICQIILEEINFKREICFKSIYRCSGRAFSIKQILLLLLVSG